MWPCSSSKFGRIVFHARFFAVLTAHIAMQWVHIVHCGLWRMKGVQADMAALSIMPATLAGRKFPDHLASTKAKQV